MEKTNVHGGDIYTYLEKTGNKPLDYSANINPLGLPDQVKAAVTSDLDSFCDYPDISCRRLKAAVASFEQIEKECLLFGNGAADLIYRICYALKPKKALLLAPTFLEYGQALSCISCQVEYYHLTSKSQFRLTQEVLSEIEGNDLFFLCNPNNPTGMLVDPGLLYRIAETCREKNCILVLDECFMDFAREPQYYSMKQYLKEFHQIIILKAFTKIFAMPGLRLGYCMCSDPAILEKIDKAGQAWSVSVPAQTAGIAAVQCRDYLEKTKKLITGERAYLTEALNGFGFTVYQSNTNFILFKSGFLNLYQRLYEKGILIRRCGNYNGLDATYYRIAVKDRSDNNRLIQAFEEIFKEKNIDMRFEADSCKDQQNSDYSRNTAGLVER